MLLLLFIVFVIVATQLEAGAIWLGIAAALLALAIIYKSFEVIVD